MIRILVSLRFQQMCPNYLNTSLENKQQIIYLLLLFTQSHPKNNHIK